MTAIVASLMALIQLGCATTATITATKPAELELGPIRSVAVLPFSGPQDLAETAREAIVSELGKDGFCAIVDPQHFQEIATAPLQTGSGPVDHQLALDTARRMNLDAIVVGKLARRQHSRFGSSSTVLIGDPVVTVSVEFQMVDVRSARVLASNRSQKSHTGEFSTDPGSRDDELQVVRQLVSECATEVVAKVVPHEAPVQVPLASQKFGKGMLAVHAGNTLARAGDWQAAALRWEEALSANAENAAATYNLGLAREAAREFDEAAQLYAAAAALGESKRCQTSLQRVEQHGGDYQIAMAQLQRRMPESSVHRFARGPIEPPLAGELAPLVPPYTPPQQPVATDATPTLELLDPANSPQAISRSARRDMMRLPPM